MVSDEATHNDNRRTKDNNIRQNLRIYTTCYRHLSLLQGRLNKLDFGHGIHTMVLEVESCMDAAVVRGNGINLTDAPPNITNRYQVYHYLPTESAGFVHSATNRNIVRHSQHRHNIGTRFKPNSCLNIAGIHDLEIRDNLELGISRADLTDGAHALSKDQRRTDLGNIDKGMHSAQDV